MLANVYLHYVLDLWIEKRMKKQYRGQTHMVRYADDFVCCFQSEGEARNFYLQLKDRLKKVQPRDSTRKEQDYRIWPI